jgi:hypothetical protein
VSASAVAAVRSALGGLGELVPGDRPRRDLDRCEFAMARTIENSLPWRGSADFRLGPAQLAGLAAAGDHDASVAAAARLLGRAPGLTPSGDDVLAGFLIGAAAFGLEAAATSSRSWRPPARGRCSLPALAR